MGASAQAATKEIYLLVGTQGIEKAKADLEYFDRQIKKVESSAKSLSQSMVKAYKDAAETGRKIEEASKKAAEAMQVASLNANGFSSALKTVGGAASRTVEILMRAAYLLPGLGFAGIVGGIVDMVSAVAGGTAQQIEYDKALKEQIEKTNKALAERKKHLEDVIALQIAAFNKQRGAIAGIAGVDPASLSPQGLQKSLELAEKQERLDITRNGLEKEYVDLLRQRALISEKGQRVGNLIEAGGLFNQAARVGQQIRAVEANLRRLRNEQIDINRDLRQFAGAPLNESEPKTKADKNTGADPLDAIKKRIAEYVKALAAFQQRYIKSILDADRNAVASLRKQQDADFALQVERYKFQQERIKEAYSAGKEAGGSGGMFAFIGEDLGAQNAADKIRGIQDAIHEGITRPAQIAKEATDQLGHGLADAAAAAILEGKSFKAAANEVLKSVARKALAMAIFEGAAALASLAILDFRGAALHGQAAATYGIVAGVAALGASATGGLRSGSGGGSSSGGTGVGAPKANTNGSGSGSGGATVYNFQVNYNGIRTSTRDHEDLIRLLNSQAGRNGAAKLDRRLVA